jgi:predicted nucleic acid-binding protein
MNIVIDTSAIISVLVGEPERQKIIEATKGHELIGPGSIPWEIGNAFSAMFKRKRLSIVEAERGFSIFKTIPIRYIEPDFLKAVRLSKQTNMYAYDSYFLECSIRYKAPLLTLDKKLKITAQNINIETMEL